LTLVLPPHPAAPRPPLFPYTTLFRSIAAVEVVAGEASAVTEILAAARAVPARAVRPPEPRDAEPPAVVGHADDLVAGDERQLGIDRKSTRLNSSHLVISYAVFCLKKK